VVVGKEKNRQGGVKKAQVTEILKIKKKDHLREDGRKGSTTGGPTPLYGGTSSQFKKPEKERE